MERKCTGELIIQEFACDRAGFKQFLGVDLIGQEIQSVSGTSGKIIRMDNFHSASDYSVNN